MLSTASYRSQRERREAHVCSYTWTGDFGRIRSHCGGGKGRRQLAGGQRGDAAVMVERTHLVLGADPGGGPEKCKLLRRRYPRRRRRAAVYTTVYPRRGDAPLRL